MLSRTKLLMLLFVCGTFAAEKAGEFPPQPSPKPDNSTTTTSTTTSTTTTPKPTPTTTTSTTTPAPAPPNNTTTTSTTTQAPNTTTTTVAPLTTTLKPTPVPAPTAGEWALNYTNTNRTCLVLKMALQLEFTDKANMTHKMNLQDKAQFKGSCDLKNGTQEGIIFQLDGHGSSLAITIQSNASKFSVVDMRSEINMTAPGANVTDYLHFVHNGTEFNTPLANSYRCLKQQTITLAGETKGVLHISQLQLQAFRNTTGNHFSTALDCEGSSTPDVVPIAVGCVLVALIVMILVGYLYGRRYCQARGYLSMFTETKREEDYIPMKNFSCFN